MNCPGCAVNYESGLLGLVPVQFLTNKFGAMQGWTPAVCPPCALILTNYIDDTKRVRFFGPNESNRQWALMQRRVSKQEPRSNAEVIAWFEAWKANVEAKPL